MNGLSRGIKMPEVATSRELEYCLQHTFEKNFPSSSNTVILRLNVGDRVQRSLGCDYEIDDANIFHYLEGYDPEGIPYGPVYRALKTLPFATMPFFRKSTVKKENKRTIVPFSEVLKGGKGECIEKAMLMQLASQELRKSFFIKGSLEIESESGAGEHAYNIIYSGKEPFLIDVENPLETDKTGKVTRPYCPRILALNLDSGELLVNEAEQHGRRYFLEL